MSTVAERPASVARELAGTIEGLYSAFSPYRYRVAMPACPHCVSDDDLLALGQGHLGELPAPLLGRYTIKAISTWGEVRDFKWLLPRLVELTVGGQLPVPAEALTAKLTRASWHEWPVAERQAVSEFLQAWWHHGLRHDPATAAVVTLRLPAVAAAEPDLTSFLTAWQAYLAGAGAPRLTSLQHLLELLCHSRFRPDVPASIETLFWEPAGPAAAQISAWLTSPDLAEELDRAIYDLATTSEARQLAIAAARLRRYRAALA